MTWKALDASGDEPRGGGQGKPVCLAWQKRSRGVMDAVCVPVNTI